MNTKVAALAAGNADGGAGFVAAPGFSTGTFGSVVGNEKLTLFGDTGRGFVLDDVFNLLATSVEFSPSPVELLRPNSFLIMLLSCWKLNCGMEFIFMKGLIVSVAFFRCGGCPLTSSPQASSCKAFSARILAFSPTLVRILPDGAAPPPPPPPPPSFDFAVG